jgi:hypothetical protein
MCNLELERTLLLLELRQNNDDPSSNAPSRARVDVYQAPKDFSVIRNIL